VCRIKRGIDVNRSTKLLLELVKPKLVKLSQEIINATGASGRDRDMIFADVQSEFVNLLLHKYIIGEWGYMLHYLFGMPKGLMRRYVTSTITRRRKYNAEMLSGPMSHSIEDHRHQNPEEKYERLERKRQHFEAATNPDETMESAHIKGLARRINGIIEDGVTLRLAEYRVLRFCLDNASDQKRPLNGLHIYMGKVLGVVRSRCTKLYADALVKVREASGFEEAEGDFEWR
jgi:hypothetical protein